MKIPLIHDIEAVHVTNFQTSSLIYFFRDVGEIPLDQLINVQTKWPFLSRFSVCLVCSFDSSTLSLVVIIGCPLVPLSTLEERSSPFAHLRSYCIGCFDTSQNGCLVAIGDHISKVVAKTLTSDLTRAVQRMTSVETFFSLTSREFEERKMIGIIATTNYCKSKDEVRARSETEKENLYWQTIPTRPFFFVECLTFVLKTAGWNRILNCFLFTLSRKC